MLAPAIAVTMPFPGVIMHGDTPAGFVVVTVVRVPAIAVAITGDIGGSRSRQCTKHASAGNCTENERPDFHACLSIVEKPPPKKNGGTRPWVPPSSKSAARGSERDPHAIAPIAATFTIIAPAHVLIVP